MALPLHDLSIYSSWFLNEFCGKVWIKGCSIHSGAPSRVMKAMLDGQHVKICLWVGGWRLEKPCWMFNFSGGYEDTLRLHVKICLRVGQLFCTLKYVHLKDVSTFAQLSTTFPVGYGERWKTERAARQARVGIYPMRRRGGVRAPPAPAATWRSLSS